MISFGELWYNTLQKECPGGHRRRNDTHATHHKRRARIWNSRVPRPRQNLWEAFAGESQARNKYTFFASVAKKEGYEQLAAIFEETAANEKEHAKMWFKALNGGSIPDTMTCLEMAAGGEHDEWTEMYPRMAAGGQGRGLYPAGCPVHHGGADREGARGALP